MDLDAFSAELREAHRDAREALNRSCNEDLTLLARLLNRPLREAGVELRAKLDALGSVEPILYRNIVAELADETALHCARKVFAKADAGFCARFGAYASAIANAEQSFIERSTRSVSLPRIDFDEDIRIALTHNISSSTIDLWLEDLDRYLHSLLRRAVDRARRTLINRGFASLARTRLALRAAAQGRTQPPRRPPS